MMLVEYQHRRGRSLNERAQEIYNGFVVDTDGQGVRTSVRVNDRRLNRTMAHGNFRALATSLGLRVYDFPENPELDTRLITLADVLLVGPVIYPCHPPGMSIDHLIVVQGSSIEDTNEVFHILDPADSGADPTRRLSYSRLISQYPPSGGYVCRY